MTGVINTDANGVVQTDANGVVQTDTDDVSITVSQQKQQVNPLRRGNFDDSVGHNTVTADISGSNLSTAYVEVSLNGGPYETLQTWGPSDLEELANRSSDGTAISNISLREAGAVRWRDAGRNELQLFYGTNANDGTEVIKKAEGTGPDSVSSPTTVLQDDSVKHQDPTVWYDNDTGNLHLLHEHGLNGSVSDHGEIGIYDAAGLDGESWSNKRLVGDGDGGITATVASPNTFTLNGNHFLLGEEHDSGNFDLLAAKGSSVDSYSQTKIVAQASDYPDVDIHVNLQGPATYTKDGTILAYSNVKYSSDGNYASAPLTTGSFDTDGFPVNWTLGPRTDTSVVALARFFNSIRVYADESQNNSSIEYWDLSGSRDERSLGSSPATVSFDIFEPTLFDGDTVSWRVVVEQADGTTTTSSSMSFDITGTANFGVSIDSISPNPASPGQTVDIQTTVTNDGTGTATQDITLSVAGTQEDIISGVTLNPGGSTTQTLSWATDSNQTEQDYTATVASADDSASQTVTVGSTTPSVPSPAVNRWVLDDVSSGTVTDSIGTADGSITQANTSVSNSKYQAGAAAESADGTDYIRTATVSWLSNLDTNAAIAFSMDNYTGSITDGTRTVGAANNAVSGSTNDRFRVHFFDNLSANLQDSSGNLILISADNPTGVADGNLHRVLVNKVANSGAGAFEIYVASSGDTGYTQVSTSVEFDQGYSGNHSWEDDFRIFETSSATGATAIDGVIDDVVLYSTDLDSTQRQQDLDTQPSFGQ